MTQPRLALIAKRLYSISMENSDLGKRMKMYEGYETERRFLPTLPVYARIDGKNFGRFTKGMVRPFDSRMIDAMVQTTKYLVENTHASIGYHQSDEISLTWHAPDYRSSIFFDGRITKMTSVLASMATAAFTRAILTSESEDFRKFADKLPHFDARVIQMPSRDEVANMFLWRTIDCFKNSVAMAAQGYFSHKSLHGMSGSQMQERLFQEKGINFSTAYPESFKRGTFVKRVSMQRKFTKEELARIPEARRPVDPEALITRTKVVAIEMPIFSRVMNRVGVIFGGEAPVIEDFKEA